MIYYLNLAQNDAIALAALESAVFDAVCAAGSGTTRDIFAQECIP